MKQRLTLFLLAALLSLPLFSQRYTDRLDRGLVAVKANTWTPVFLSWRVLGEEYFGTQYNVYRDGELVNTDGPLSVSTYRDAAGTADSRYTVRPVVRGVERADLESKVATPWSQSYLEVKMDHGSLVSTYIPNDACCADVDGDGELEILLKFDNRSDANGGYMPGGYKGEYAIIEVYKLSGEKLWWIDLGPNMADFQNNENNIVAYDWDMDGCAEALMRAADGTVIHTADGTEYVVGDRSQNYRNTAGSSDQWFINFGREYLVYMDGRTGQPYQVMDYPLPRLEPEEWATLTTKCDYNDYPTLWQHQGNYYDKSSGVLARAWGDNYGHRSTKHFFGAPYLDGRHPSIFLGRGIYTRHKFLAMDVDPATHELSVRWRWNCNDSKSDWYGNGYHNYGIADVDWDGRDEIVWGSMVIDDNGRGLSTTAYRHGDAQHCGDLDPYSWGQEIFACLEEGPQYGNNFRDATTSNVYYKYDASSDDGRCIMGNFSNSYPGCIGTSANDPGVVSSVSHAVITGASKNNMAQNFRIYWDGDLLEETFNYIKFNTTPTREDTGVQIIKYGRGAIASWTDVHTNNDTKGTPCYQGDLLGDWREEVILRTKDNNIRIYTTTTETTWRIPTLWSDHQYRNAMVWQMCGYNQPPHLSYFLGELEGITIAPPTNTLTGRTELKGGSTIAGEAGDELLLCEAADVEATVAEGAQPSVFIDNAPSWVQGTDVDGTTSKDNCPIVYQYYTHTLHGAAFTGDTRVVKQGDGTLVLPAVEQTYTGTTDVWAGTLQFDGCLAESRLWLNRHTTLVSDGGIFSRGIQADYNATIVPGGHDHVGAITADSLLLGFGARVLVDLYSDGLRADTLKARVLKVEKKTWRNGPKYLVPVVEVVPHMEAGADRLAPGRYLVMEVESVEGEVANLVVEGMTSQDLSLVLEDGKVYVEVADLRQPDVATWTGKAGSVWNAFDVMNFSVGSKTADVFIDGDQVVFDDRAVAVQGRANVTVEGSLKPSSVAFDNSRLAYYLDGDGSIDGNVSLTKSGTGVVTINNLNMFEGDISVNGGRLIAKTLPSQAAGTQNGSLGSIDNVVTLTNGAAIGVNETTANGHTIRLGEGGGSIDVAQGKTFTLEKPVLSDVDAPLYLVGAGTLELAPGNTFGKVYLEQGRISVPVGNCFNDTVVLGNGTVIEFHHTGTGPATDNTRLSMPAGMSATLYLDGQCDQAGSLDGGGRLALMPAGTQNYLVADWSRFEGTLAVGATGSKWLGLKQGFGLDSATLDVAEGATVEALADVALGSISGSGTLKGSGIYTIGSNQADFTYSGDMLSSVVKTGAGRWTISSARPQTGIPAVTVNEGELLLTSNFAFTTQFLGEATVTVQSAGTLMGNGIVYSIVLNAGGTLAPGTATSKTGPMTATAALTANKGSVVQLSISNANGTSRSRSYLNTDGALTLNGELVVALAGTFVPEAGNEFTLWQSQSFGGEPLLTLPDLPEGLEWDTTALLQPTGVLRVVKSSAGIRSVGLAASGRCRVYTLGGQLVADVDGADLSADAVAAALPLRAGVYVVRTAGQPARKLTVK